MDDSKKRPEKYGRQNQSDSQFSPLEDNASCSNARTSTLTILDERSDSLLKLERQKDPPEDTKRGQNEVGDMPSRCIAQEKLRYFSHKTMETLENERKLVAREIHDELGGSLAAIKFLLEDILSRNGDNREIAEPLRHTVRCIKDTIKKTRRISAGLRPVMLDDLGLKATIRWCCGKLKQSFPQITLIVEVDINESIIDDSQKILIYRIIQEAMTNAATHGGADTIWLSLTQSNERLELEITDNGCGFDTGRILSGKYRNGNGYGLTGIKAKTEICGGVFCINSLENKGTDLRITLPLTGC